MSCIVGIVENGKMYFGADSAGVDSSFNLRVRKDEKVFINSGFIMGFTSSFRMGQLLRYSFTPPQIKENQDVYSYMATDFVDAVRDLFKRGGYLVSEKGEEQGGSFLVGYKGRLFNIQDDFQVAECVENYDAVGCGEGYALGSLYSTQKLEPKERLKTALECAENFSAGVRAPFNFIEL